MELLKEMWKLKNHKLRFTTEDGEYEGVVKFISPSIKKITFDKVFILPQREPFSGTQNFYANELESYTVISEPKTAPPANTNVETDAYSSMNAAKKTEYCFADFCNEDFMESDEDNKEEPEEEYVLVLPKHLKKQLPQNSVIIDEIDPLFYSAIEHIKQHSTIGVSFEGVCIGRSGQLCWINISTSYCTFLFDMLALQKMALEEGLKEIFENPKVQKVMHDCRQPSDALFHQYNTNLVNVFDTQVADTFVNMQYNKNKKIGEYVLSLDVCLSRHLELEQDYIFVQKIRQSIIKETQSVWKTRPITNALRDGAIKNVIYLRLLHTDLLNKMLSSFTRGVDLYLQVLKDASPQELELEPSDPHRVPESFLMAGLQIAQMKEFTRDCSNRNIERVINHEEIKNPIDKYLNYLDNNKSSSGCQKSSTTVVLKENSRHYNNVKLQPFGPKSMFDPTEPSIVPKSKKTDKTEPSVEWMNSTNSSDGHSEISIREKTPMSWPKVSTNSKLSQKIKFMPAGIDLTARRTNAVPISAEKPKKVEETEPLVVPMTAHSSEKIAESVPYVVNTFFSNRDCEISVKEKNQVIWPKVTTNSVLSSKVQLMPAGMHFTRERKCQRKNHHLR